MSDGYYSPQMIDRWIRSWALLEALAETPRSARHHLQPGHAEHPGACAVAPRVGSSGQGQHQDPHRYVFVMADIKTAVEQLPDGLGRRAVLERMRSGGSLGAVAEQLRTRKRDVCEAYRAAVDEMAVSLGWSASD